MKATDSFRSITELGPGEHACCLYETEEQQRVSLTAFLRQGLEWGEKVVYFADPQTAKAIVSCLRHNGLDVARCVATGQLQILTAAEAYMREGVFDPDRMIAFLRAETERALAEGYRALRVTGEMTWALRGLPGSDRLIEYEAKLNTFFPGSRCLALCQYDRRRFPPALLLDVLSTHPTVVVGTTLYENIYYAPRKESVANDVS